MNKTASSYQCRHSVNFARAVLFSLLTASGCATPQYSLRSTPIPNESGSVTDFERTISAYQAQELDKQGSRIIRQSDKVFGFDVYSMVNRLSRVTERPNLRYTTFLLQDEDPNAVALPDGRIYLTTGVLNYLASRGSRPGELAFILSHEMAHTCAQHLLKRYKQLQKQQLMLKLVAIGSSAVAQKAGSHAQTISSLANNTASLISQTVISGYSQEDELEADQLGIRYCIKAGFDTRDALELLKDFERFETPWPLFRSHPYIQKRRQDLERYLMDSKIQTGPAQTYSFKQSSPITFQDSRLSERRKRLLEAQKLYPIGSVSWKNIQKQLESLEK